MNIRILSSFLLIFCGVILAPTALQAQTERILNGLVVSADGQPLRGVAVSIDKNKRVSTNQEGKFTLIMSRAVKKPETVDAVYKNYYLQDWEFNQARRAIRIVMTPRPINLEGKVLDMKGRPIKDIEVMLNGVSESPVVTDSKGSFVLQVPGGTKPEVFTVGKERVTDFKFNSKLSYIEIKIERALIEDQVLADGKFPVVEGSPDTQQGSTQAQEAARTFEEIGGLKPTLIVVVYDEDISPAESMAVTVDGRKYVTDENGEFKVITDSISNSAFEVESHEIIKKQYDYEDNYMFIHIKDPESEDEFDVDEIDFKGNFEIVFEQLESEKQMLQENGAELRKEIMKISEKLGKEDRIASKEKESLEAYMQRLEAALVENELAYQDAQFKTHTMLEKMKSQIVETDEKLVEIEEEKKVQELELELLFGVAVVLVVLLVVFFRFYSKIKKQHEELEETHRELKSTQEEVIKAQDDMLAVREIGQTFTSSLHFEEHMEEVKQRVSALVDATIIGIGIYDDMRKKLVFIGTQDREKELDTFEESVEDDESLAAWCFGHKNQVVINDAESEYNNYVPEEKGTYKEGMPQSVIYMPLMIEEEVVGVITVQSYDRGAYIDGNKVSSLKTLASYAAIAVANSNAYKVIRHKNESITDSIRYAKTIQDAILPTKDFMDGLFRDYFVIYKARDIVSGDFYWVHKFTDISGVEKLAIAVVDCTGHGVPGAFMSMIGNTMLNEILSSSQQIDTSNMLEELDRGVKMALKQDKGHNDDGMDICLCIIEKQSEEKSKVTFTGAKRPLYYMPSNSGKITTFSGDLRSIGGFHKSDRKFTTQELIVYKDDIIYLTSDGFIDQNNPGREKFGTPRLFKTLEENDWQTMDRQREVLETTLLEHQGATEQRDDITILGIKF